MEINGTITMYLNEDNMCGVNILNLAQNLTNYPVEAYLHGVCFGSLSFCWRNEKFEIIDEVWSICSGISNTLANIQKIGKGHTALSTNYTQDLSYQIIEHNGIQWFYIIRQQGYEPRIVFEEKNFPLFSFIAKFLPIAKAFFEYQIALRQRLKRPYSETMNAFWKENIDKVQTFFDDNTAAYDAERGIIE